MLFLILYNLPILKIEKTTLPRKENIFHHNSYVIIFNYLYLNNTYVIGMKVPLAANLCCCKTLGAEGFIVRRLGRDKVCIDGLVKLWGKLFTLRWWAVYVHFWAKNQGMTFMTCLKSVLNSMWCWIKLSLKLFRRLIY